MDKDWLEQMLELQKKAQQMQPDLGKQVADLLKGVTGGWLSQSKQVKDETEDLTALLELWNIGGETSTNNGTEPLLTIMEGRKDITISGFLPGIRNSDDINIKLHGNTLFIKGKSDKLQRVQEEAGAFNRIIRLPVEVEPHGTKASYRNGFLDIRLNKKQQDTYIIQVDF